MKINSQPTNSHPSTSLLSSSPSHQSILSNKRFSNLFRSKPRVSSPLTVELELQTPVSELSTTDPVSYSSHSDRLSIRCRLLTALLELLFSSLFSLSLSRRLDLRSEGTLLLSQFNRLGYLRLDLSNLLMIFVILRTLSCLIHRQNTSAGGKASSPPVLVPSKIPLSKLSRTGLSYIALIGLSIWVPTTNRLIVESIAWISLVLGVGLMVVGLLSLVEMIVELDESNLYGLDDEKNGRSRFTNPTANLSSRSTMMMRNDVKIPIGRSGRGRNSSGQSISPLRALMIKKRYNHLYNSF
ncbi:expressed protein [Phakopsora pachyrhizi]|uniref:Expressed protein n=1 Tax=Phakopsora pachyrhizi TaxID=170000 RepID=A0AAV0BES7_PHAPC|nr:expressed protein [Phakopsora pachyrhizi]